MAEYLVGARYICLSCRERGVHLACARCGKKTLDLADPSDRATLAARWSGARAFEAGLGLWSLRNLRLARRLRTATLFMTAFVIVGASASAMYDLRHGPRAELLGILIGIPIMGLLWAPLLGVFLLVYANVVRILGLIFEIFVSFTSAAPRLIRGSLRLRFGLVRTIFWWIESALLPRITLSPPPTASGLVVRGALITPLTLSILVDESGWLWCTDAVVPPFAIRTAEDQRIEVKLDAGAVTIPPQLAQRVGTPGEAAPWLTPPPRGRRFQRILAAGTRLRCSGGQLGEALCGTPSAPLLVVFGDGA